jgi:hypothetical protein
LPRTLALRTLAYCALQRSAARLYALRQRTARIYRALRAP